VAFADEIQELIRSLDTDQTQGWIVDLSQNTGGNMWPMIAGIGPLLGEGTVGWFIDRDGGQLEWRYESGKSICNGEVVTACSKQAHEPRRAYPVGVLIGNQTGSSGEALVTAFSGREKTRLFGEETHGLSTGNQSHVLEDGATIYLTEVIFADRNGKRFGGVIKPDVEVPSDLDVLISVATKWLQEQF
jgi:carboxyl-terminal processing protease